MKKYHNHIYIILIVIFIVVVFHFLLKNKLLAPVNGRLTSPFGNRVHPITGGIKFHNGIDIAAPTGTPIKAPASGKVVSKYYNALGGNSLVIQRKDGFRLGFAHLSGYNVDLNDSVKIGQTIGYVGSTGASTGPHLHFTVKNKQGNYLNPQKLIV